MNRFNLSKKVQTYCFSTFYGYPFYWAGSVQTFPPIGPKKELLDNIGNTLPIGCIRSE
jgi:hypothetical protein